MLSEAVAKPHLKEEMSTILRTIGFRLMMC